MLFAIIFGWIFLFQKTGSTKGHVLNEYAPLARSSEELTMRSGPGNDVPLSGSTGSLKLLSVLPARYFLDRPMQQSSDAYTAKRSWKSLNGSWGKRDGSSTIDESDIARWLANDDNDYDDSNAIIQRVATYLPREQYQSTLPAKEKRKSWNAMKAAWGKRFAKSGSSDWTKARGNQHKPKTHVQ